ncbi:MAG: hypothetical protein LBI30_01085, partial [Holosporales bacterium]|nr:hypothetical protein [Holosporales bacterium]
MVCCRKWVLLTIVAFFSTSALLCEAKGQNVQQIALIDASTAGEQSVVVEQDVNIDGVAYETKKITKSDKAKNGIGDNAWVRAKKFFGKLFQK